MSVPKAGDILQLSQIAWKISRTFTAGRKDAPSEFQEIEVEVSGLSKTLKLFAECLHTDDSQALLARANTDVQSGVATIFKSCQKTVNDLDSLVDQYQVIKKHRTVGGFAIERSWGDLILAKYRTVMWTAEGGTMRNLKDLLQMHASCILILVKALQSKSQARLQKVVAPMANRIESIYHTDLNLDEQLEEVHRMIDQLSVADVQTRSPPIPARNPARSPIIEAPNPLGTTPDDWPLPPNSLRQQNPAISLSEIPQSSTSPEPSSPIGHNFYGHNPASPTRSRQVCQSISPKQKRVSEHSFNGASLRYSSSSYASSTTSSGGWSDNGTLRDSLISRQTSPSTKKTSPLPYTPELREPGDRRSDATLSLLPPPALGLSAPYELERPTSRSTLSPYPQVHSEITKLHRSSTTTSQKAAFEKEAFRNSAILCDVRGKLVEYSHQINEDDPRDVEMVQATEDCRIAVVRKRVHDSESHGVRVVTSVWAFSDDNTVRLELRMDDTQMYIPYSSYFSPTKVSITVPCELKFHDVKHGNRPTQLTKTSWVNYVFEKPQAAALFQNELMGRTLLCTFRTEKTMRIHEGLSKSFSYAEQMCGLENLRVWEDNDTGAVIALIHFSADFRSGYLAFYLNSSTNPIKVKDDGAREVKIKGLRVPIDRGERATRKDSVVVGSEKGKGKESGGIGGGSGSGKLEKEKVISGAKIEFATEMEKREFLEMCKEMQRELIELPELLGVN